MLEYLSNLLPRLRQYSETLDKKEILIDQPWVLIDKGLNKQQYIFERSGRLLVSVNGETEIGKWEYIPAVKSLLIHMSDNHLMLK